VSDDLQIKYVRGGCHPGWGWSELEIFSDGKVNLVASQVIVDIVPT